MQSGTELGSRSKPTLKSHIQQTLLGDPKSPIEKKGSKETSVISPEPKSKDTPCAQKKGTTTELTIDFSNGNDKKLLKFCEESKNNLLVCLGGGTSTLTYLFTTEESEFSHVLILGNRGYWETSSHRLAQPLHIFALPHRTSDKFIDSALHDETFNILPHEEKSAYVHSSAYQNRLIELEKATCEALNARGIHVFIVRNVWGKISRQDSNSLVVQIDKFSLPISAKKIIAATGAGPERQLDKSLQTMLRNSLPEPTDDIYERVLNYTDVLTASIVQKAKGQDVIVYGGGATAAWAVEVAALTANPLAWVAKSGFGESKGAGPRVKAIIAKTQPIQLVGTITELFYKINKDTGAKKISVTVTIDGTKKIYEVDWLFNCIGQDQYVSQANSLPEILSTDLRESLVPLLDSDNVAGTPTPCILGWCTPQKDLIIAGAAQGTFYHKDRDAPKGGLITDRLPRSAQVAITIGGVVSSVSAITKYINSKQDPKTRKVSLKSLNLNVMNATQLAVYFTGSYQCASAKQVNDAVDQFIAERSKTEFGLTPEREAEFLEQHFGKYREEKLDVVPDATKIEASHVDDQIIDATKAIVLSSPKNFAPRLFDHDISLSPPVSSDLVRGAGLIDSFDL